MNKKILLVLTLLNVNMQKRMMRIEMMKKIAVLCLLSGTHNLVTILLTEARTPARVSPAMTAWV